MSSLRSASSRRFCWVLILNEKQREFSAPGVKRVTPLYNPHFQVTRYYHPRYGSHVIRLAKHRKVAPGCVGPWEGADLHGRATHGSSRRPLVRWKSAVCSGGICSHMTRSGSAERLTFACHRYVPRLGERSNGEAPRHRERGTSHHGMLASLVDELSTFGSICSPSKITSVAPSASNTRSNAVSRRLYLTSSGSKPIRSLRV